jgi:hypothetical protein
MASDPVESYPDASPHSRGIPLVDGLIASLPEFVPTYEELVTAGDDRPGDAVVLIELADFVASQLATFETADALLTRALGYIEVLIDTEWAEDTDRSKDIMLAFFDSLCPDDRIRLTRWLGSCSKFLVDRLDAPVGD